MLTRLFAFSGRFRHPPCGASSIPETAGHLDGAWKRFVGKHNEQRPKHSRSRWQAGRSCLPGQQEAILQAGNLRGEHPR